MIDLFLVRGTVDPFDVAMRGTGALTGSPGTRIVANYLRVDSE
jgi:hypothetical protein